MGKHLNPLEKEAFNPEVQKRSAIEDERISV